MSELGKYLDKIEADMKELKRLICILDENAYHEGYGDGQRDAKKEAANERPTP